MRHNEIRDTFANLTISPNVARRDETFNEKSTTGDDAGLDGKASDIGHRGSR